MDDDVLSEGHTRNLNALLAMPDSEYRAHYREYAVMSQGRILSYHGTVREALSAGRRLCRDGNFSVQEVDKEPISIGVGTID